MYQSFDAFEYMDYLRRRWRVAGIACGVALVLSLPLSLLLPKRYTATASIVIEPPGNTDTRTAIVVSPMYLESLKTYERFADSDSLFARAAEKFHLQGNGAARPIESLKRGVLKVSKLRDTKIMEISATLTDPKLAQSVAQYLAEETVSLSHGESLDADLESITSAEKQAAASARKLSEVQQAWAALTIREPVESLQGELDSSVEMRGKLRQQLVDAQANIAEYQEQSKADSQFAREQLQSERARENVIEKRLQELTRSIQELGATMASRSAKRDALQNDLKSEQKAAEAADTRFRELRAAAGSRGERLRVMDPGIVPQRPSSPNVPLNVAAALLLALAASIVYLSFAFVKRRRAVGFEPAVTRGMRA
jgi:succinoglycan biosynthesis transport protein ExoP